MVDYLGTFEPMEDVVVELERLFMFLGAKRGPCHL